MIEIGKTLYLGIDGGGTKCQASLYDAELNLLGTGLAGPANAINGIERTINAITDAATAAVENAGFDKSILSQVNAGIGLAGVNLSHLFDQILAWKHIFKTMYLTTDLNIACMGAHKTHQGAVFIIGTGSVAFSRSKSIKEDLIIGGHGFLLGDKASGAWLGQQALQAVLLARDNLARQTQLTQLIENKLDCTDDMIITKMAGAIPKDFAKLAKLVFKAAENNDAVALAIIHDAVAYIKEVIIKLLNTKPHRLSLVGGITKIIQPWLNKDLLKKIEPQLESPEYGAALFIKQQCESRLSEKLG